MDRILTVITPAASKNLTSLTNVKADLKIPDTDTTRDVDITRWIPVASRAASNYCNREFISEVVSEQFRSYPFVDSASLTNLPNFIYLRRLPVTAFTSVTEDDVVLVLGTDFECDKDTGRLVRLNDDMPIPWCFRKLVVQYTGGYTYPGTLEPDIEQAAIGIVKDIFFSATRDPALMEQDSQGPAGRQRYWVGSINGGAWPVAIVTLLSPWQGPIF